MGHRWIITEVAQHIIDNPNRTISIGELTSLSGRTSTQVVAALNKWRSRPEVGDKLQVVVPGRAWLWNDARTKVAPRPEPTNGHAPTTGAPAHGMPTVTLDREAFPQPVRFDQRLTFEHIGQSATGAHVLRANNGKLYTATEL